MNELWAVLLSNSVAAAAIAVVAMIVMRLMRRPALAHVLWLLALAKLLTPPLWAVHVPWITVAMETESKREPVPENVALAPRAEFVAVPAPIDAGLISMDTTPPPASASTNAAPTTTFNLASILLSIWIGGSVFAAIVLLRRVARLRSMLKLAEPPSRELIARVRVLSERFGLARAPEVRVLPQSISPAVCCLGRAPVLLVPRWLFDSMNDVERDAVIAHELAHVHRRDHWVRAFQAAVGVLFWWHPLLWLAAREIRDAEEQCCDAWVVWALPQRGPDYASALVTTLDFVSRPERAVLALPLSSGMGRRRLLGQLERRLTMICTTPAPRTLSVFGRAVVILTLLALPMMPALSSSARAQQTRDEASGRGESRSTEDVAAAALINACLDKDEAVRTAAFESLVQFREAAVPALVEALAKEDRRAVAIGVIQRIGWRALPGLLKGLQSKDAAVRAVVAEAISQSLYADKDYFPPAPRLGGPGMDPGHPRGGAPGRVWGAPGYGGGFVGIAPGMSIIGPDGAVIHEEHGKFLATVEQTAESLAKAGGDPDATVRLHVTIALGKIGPSLEPIVPALLGALKDRDAAVRRAATQALVPAVHHAPAAVMPALIAALKDADAEVRNAASQGLLNLGSSAKEAIPALVELLKDEDPSVRRTAALAIGRIRSDVKAPQAGDGNPAAPGGRGGFGGGSSYGGGRRY